MLYSAYLRVGVLVFQSLEKLHNMFVSVCVCLCFVFVVLIVSQNLFVPVSLPLCQCICVYMCFLVCALTFLCVFCVLMSLPVTAECSYTYMFVTWMLVDTPVYVIVF